MNMIEKMAKAYWNAGLMVPRWDDESEDQRQVVRQRMRAVLEALREPTDEMINAKDFRGERAIWDASSCHYCGGPKENWNIMVDAALAETPAA